ncbi:MAG: aromatic ring-hydroxylating dioxygenase subunit alpha [Pseudomonadota bacterium]
MNVRAQFSDPANYEQVLRPNASAHCLPAWCYGSEEFFELERQRVFARSWVGVGRQELLPLTGDFRTLDVAGVPIIIIRGEDGDLRAFANSCRHRGMRLLEEKGNCRAIACPFHGWKYKLDGRLLGVPHMEQADGFDRNAYGLKPVRLETQDGFVFVCLDEDQVSLAEWLGDFSERHAPYGFEKLRCTWQTTYEVECNWKPFVEVFMEYYHLQWVHGGTFDSIDYKAPVPHEQTSGQYTTVFGFHNEGSAAVIDEAAAPLPPIPGLSEVLQRATRYTMIFPGFIMASTADCMWYFECHPLSSGKSRFILGTCFPEETIALPDFEERQKSYQERWHVAAMEDIAVLERQQLGLTSPLAESGPLSHLEYAVGDLAKFIARQVTS